MGDNVGKKDIGSMMGMGGNSGIGDDKISRMLGNEAPSKSPNVFGESPVSDEKIKRMLGR